MSHGNEPPRNPYAPPPIGERAPSQPGGAVAPEAIAAATTDGRFCVGCAYQLDGLPVDGTCPECGTPIELSLREPTLANTSQEYLRTIKSGLSFVLNGILLMIMVQVLTIVATFAAMAAPGSIGSVTLIAQFAGLGVSLLIIVGYWKYTAPDPSQVALEKSNAARKVIRIVVASQAAVSVVSVVLSLLTPATAQAAAAAGGAMNPGGMVILAFTAVLGIVGLVLWAVQFFAVMRYTRWIAARVPDLFVVKRTKVYVWLLPVIGFVGAFALMLGPLIALVMYWNLLDRMRKHVKAIIKTGEPAKLKGRLA